MEGTGSGMALAKEGYTSTIRGTTKVNVPIDSEGLIVTDTSLSVANLKFQVSAVNAENSLNDNTDVLNFFIGLANGLSDSNTNTMQVTWEV